MSEVYYVRNKKTGKYHNGERGYCEGRLIEDVRPFKSLRSAKSEKTKSQYEVVVFELIEKETI